MGLFWIIVAYIAGMMAMLLEMFIPGVIIGVTGFLVVCGSIIYAYTNEHTVAGTVLVVTTALLIPIFFVVWRNVLGRFWALKTDLKGIRPSTTIDESLLGKEGEALSLLRPSGTAQIEGKRWSVVTRGEVLEKGTRVKILDVSGNRIVVKKV